MDRYAHVSGKVFLVGAGPSDAALLTIKGRQVLERAETVIYDALIGHEILGLIPQEAEKINVGKRAGRHTMKQEDINRIIADKASEGKLVVRLKGGDPFLFGRGAEELELLVQRGIPYEIVPGVTSASAAPAYSGIPLTCRDISSSVHILTGHKKQDEPQDINFKALVQAGGTYVILMGLSAIHEIMQGFLDAGMDPDTPAAVIQEGAGAGQRCVTASAAALEEAVCRYNIQTPAVIVVGAAAALGSRFAWYEKLPLSGSRILTARPAARSKELADALRSLGAEVLESPAIRTELRPCTQQLREALSQISGYRYLVFTSPAGIEYFFELLRQMDLDIRCIGNIGLAVIGSATGAALRKYGLQPELMPESYNSAALGRLLNQSLENGQRVLVLRSSVGSPDLIKEIQYGKQIQVTDLAVYDTIYVTDSPWDLKELFETGNIEMAVFTSASAVRGFVRAAPGLDHTKIRAVCIGRATAGRAAEYGMQVHTAQKETVESLIETAVLLHRKLHE